MAEHYLWCYTPDGVYLDTIRDFDYLDYAKTENDIGVMSLSIAKDKWKGLPLNDGIIEIYRQIDGMAPVLELDCLWFIKTWSAPKKKGTYEITAYDGNFWLNRHVIPYCAGTDYTEKLDYADDMLKDFVRENYGVAALDASRNVIPYLIVASDTSSAVIVSKSSPFVDNVINLFKDICNAALNYGQYMVFDVTKASLNSMIFNTYIGQRGVNRGLTSTSPVTVSEDGDTLVDSVLTYDYSKEANYAYVVGKGEGIDAPVVEVASTRMNATPFNRMEIIVKDQTTSDTDALASTGVAALMANRPRAILEGKLKDSNRIRYGVNYKFGDIVVGEQDGVSMDCHITSIHVSRSGGKESIDARIRGEMYV
jgi:hypothetical protein